MLNIEPGGYFWELLGSFSFFFLLFLGALQLFLLFFSSPAICGFRFLPRSVCVRVCEFVCVLSATTTALS